MKKGMWLFFIKNYLIPHNDASYELKLSDRLGRARSLILFRTESPQIKKSLKILILSREYYP